MARTNPQHAQTQHAPSSAGSTETNENVQAYIGRGVHFKGRIIYSGNIRIDGGMEGEIHTDGCLWIGEGAVVNATVSARTIVSMGTMAGDITAEETVQLRPPAVLNGTLATPLLSMGEGVLLNGRVTMAPNPVAASFGYPDKVPSEALTSAEVLHELLPADPS